MARASDVIDVEEGKELEQQAPVAEHAGGEGDHAAQVESAFNEGELDALVEEIGGAENEPTADDLRKIAGVDAAGLTDDQLLAEYKKAVAAEAGDGEAVTADTPVNELPFPVYDAQGNKITSDKLTLADVLNGKVQIGYNAMGKEQRKSLQEILRVAANGHYNESKMTSLMSERAQVAKQLADLRKEHDSWGTDRKVWDKVLTAYLNGNGEPLKQLLQAYKTELGKAPADAPVDTTANDREMEAAGQRFVLDTIVPAATKMASDYGANATEVTNAILHAIQQEPPEFLTRDKIANIINYEIPALLEQNGYARSGNGAAAPAAPADATAQKLAAMEKQIQELTAGKANAATAAVRTRRAPPAGGGSTPSAGESMPSMKSREDMKKFLRGEID